MYRDHTKVIKIGNRVIGGGNPILIQSMTNTKTEDIRTMAKPTKPKMMYLSLIDDSIFR